MEKRIPNEGFVYRVSVPDEWEELQRTGATLGGDIDRTTGCIHFSDLDQVKMVLNNFFRGQENLYLLQIDATKGQLADPSCLYTERGLPSKRVITLGRNEFYLSVTCLDTYFPHFYGPDRSFQPLPLDAVSKVEKLLILNGEFSCSLLD
ncbi:uncharacterized protein LOC122048766 [Zingiber officinale]|uniref:uncharacterized protein LOC122048766 n=1 Tax=Zingiber officinale TaxID=94328 RepID=UPI001C4C1B83|nr:uncharacterized protein LOC122048766 [Zingiber officinale]